MKILFGVQTTGNGHIARAKEIISILTKRAEVDVIFSGPKANKISFKHPIKKHYRGLTFFYTKKGKIHWVKTLLKNNFLKLFIDIFECDVHSYDLILNDFEPITAWSSYLKNKKCIALSNQFSLLSDKGPKLNKRFKTSLRILRYFAPAQSGYGFHFKKFDTNIFLPIIRKEIRKLKVNDLGHYLVYLPSYNRDEIKKVLVTFPSIKWFVFSQEFETPKLEKNIYWETINENTFSKCLASCKGVITAAGFSTLSEALYLKKPVLTIPIGSHIEQIYNAKMIREMGGIVIKRLSIKHRKQIQNWINNPKVIPIKLNQKNYEVVDRILIDYIKSKTDSKYNSYKTSLTKTI